MFKRTVWIVVVMMIGLIGVGARVAWAQDGTVPTRTPTPDPNQPTRVTPTATRDGSDNPPPSPTTQTGATTATPSPTGTLPGTATGVTPGAPAPGATAGTATGANAPFAPVAPGGCDETPYIRAIARLTAHAGPGSDYEAAATLEAEEMRRIVGRAAFAPWWQIQLDMTTVGWVADAEVDEFGNTALVPVVAPTAQDGETPTPGAPWNPTPLPLLTCVPTPTPSATPTGTIVTTPAAESGAAAQSTPAIQEGTVTGAGGNTSTAEESDALPGLGVGSRGAESSRAASPTSAVNLILPIAGLVLIAGGILLALFSRNRGGPPDTTPK